MVNPEMLTIPAWTLKMRKVGVPTMVLLCTVRFEAPGPEITKSLLISNSPLVNTIVPLTEKSIFSPGAAPAIAARNEPEPLSAVLVTVAASPGKTIAEAAKHRTQAVLIFIGSANCSRSLPSPRVYQSHVQTFCRALWYPSKERNFILQGDSRIADLPIGPTPVPGVGSSSRHGA